MSAVQILGTLSMFGFGPLAVREVPRIAASGHELSGFLRHAFVTVLLVSTAAAVALAIIATTTGLMPPAYRTAFGIGAFLVAPLALIALFRGIAQGFGRIALAQTPGEVMRPGALVLLMGAVVVLGLPFRSTDYMWSAAGAGVVAAIIGGAWLWVSERADLRPSHPSSDRRHFAAALPVLGLGLASMLQGEMNTLLLGWLASPHEAGLFQPIVRLTPVLTLAVQAAGMRYAPRMAEMWERGEMDRIRSVTSKFTWTTSLLTLASALAIAACGPWLMRVFGPEFSQSAPLLWYVAGAQVFNAACGPVGMLLTMSGRSAQALGGQIAGLAVNATVGAVLIPTYGARGAVIAMVAGILIWNLSTLAMASARFGFDPSLAGALLRRRTMG
jgi:O-antigen/teichoic acid export membrane protein